MKIRLLLFVPLAAAIIALLWLKWPSPRSSEVTVVQPDLPTSADTLTQELASDTTVASNVSPDSQSTPASLHLRGTLVTQAGKSVAILEQTTGDVLIQEGAEIAPGSVITSVQKDRIIVTRDGQQQAVPLTGNPGQNQAEPSNRAGEQVVNLDELSLSWNRPGKLKNRIRLQPAYQNGDDTVNASTPKARATSAKSGLS